MNTREQQLQSFGRLLDIMDDLRAKCPWDMKQTMQSLRHLTIEETYELGDAILDNDLQEIKKDMQSNQASFWINTFKFESANRKGKLLFEYLNSKAVTGRKIAKAINEINGFE